MLMLPWQYICCSQLKKRGCLCHWYVKVVCFILLYFISFISTFLSSISPKSKKHCTVDWSNTCVWVRIACACPCALSVWDPRDCPLVPLSSPFPLMKGSWQSRGKWCVSICILRREVEAKSQCVSIIFVCPFHRVEDQSLAIWDSSHPILLWFMEKHLPECGLGCLGLQVKCLW